MGSGKLLAQGGIQELKQIHEQTYDVRLKGAMTSFAKRLAELGCNAELQDDVLRVRLSGGQSQQLLWEVAAGQNEQIRYLRPQRSTLEEVFLKAVERT
jgi:ABC-2 type transport system ATP-binding protein